MRRLGTAVLFLAILSSLGISQGRVGTPPRGVVYERTEGATGRSYVGRAMTEHQFQDYVREHPGSRFRVISRPVQADLEAEARSALRGVPKNPSFTDYRSRGVVYERYDPATGRAYVGQAWDQERFEQRMREHDKRLEAERGRGAHYEFKVLSRPYQAELDMVEQAWINKRSGLARDGGTLENKRNQVREYEREAEVRRTESPTERFARRAEQLDRASKRVSDQRTRDARMENERHVRETRERQERERGYRRG